MQKDLEDMVTDGMIDVEFDGGEDEYVKNMNVQEESEKRRRKQ